MKICLTRRRRGLLAALEVAERTATQSRGWYRQVIKDNRKRREQSTMTSNSIRSILAVCTITALAGLPAARNAFAQKSAAQVNPGTIVGMVTDAKRAPLGGATVTATRLDNHSIRGTMSNSEGIYSFSDVAPGIYTVTSEADGYSETRVSRVEVSSGRPATVIITMA